MRGNGYADRLVLDKYNHVVSQTKGKDGKFTQRSIDKINGFFPLGNLSDFFLIGLELKSYASCGSINIMIG
jgi:hypothetical protein